MKVRIVPYIVFFVASLAFAWFASRPSLQSESMGKEWISISKESLKKIVYTDENGTVEVSKDPTAPEAFWIDSAETRKEGPNDVSVKDRYLVGDRMKELLAELAPFRVEKQIGEAGKVNLADFGLDKPTGTFEVQYGEGKTFTLLMGKRSFQSPTVFVLDKDKNLVLLVQRKVMSMLEKPKARMAMSKPFSLAEDDVSQVYVHQDNKTWKFYRKTQGSEKVWYPEATDKPAEAFRNWIDKVLKLRVEGYPQDDQKEALSKLVPKFSMELKTDRADLDTWSILEEAGTPTRYWLKAGKLPVPVLIDATKVPVLVNDMKAFLQ
ncbi:MAG TPA: DUF4340 domain-containing protein [Oligoflexus sp.]|uniref:DUF4340 domain-containing protein n=1 Tax=Oligoflexus sp. TaxID=1971216 RepID=UPI002D5A6B17|nr:DUF4340 domain-containing protein [Oligoflexus sp.]HYX39879.1 DUF4340 domain-containing protein [Oligoflexus sp.]